LRQRGRENVTPTSMKPEGGKKWLFGGKKRREYTSPPRDLGRSKGRRKRKSTPSVREKREGKRRIKVISMWISVWGEKGRREKVH